MFTDLLHFLIKSQISNGLKLVRRQYLSLGFSVLDMAMDLSSERSGTTAYKERIKSLRVLLPLLVCVYDMYMFKGPCASR